MPICAISHPPSMANVALTHKWIADGKPCPAPNDEFIHRSAAAAVQCHDAVPNPVGHHPAHRPCCSPGLECIGPAKYNAPFFQFPSPIYQLPKLLLFFRAVQHKIRCLIISLCASHYCGEVYFGCARRPHAVTQVILHARYSICQVIQYSSNTWCSMCTSHSIAVLGSVRQAPLPPCRVMWPRPSSTS